MRTSIAIAVTLLFSTFPVIGLLSGCSSETETDLPETTATANEEAPASADKPPAVASSDQGDTISQEIKYEMSGIPFDLTGEPVNVGGLNFVPAIQWELLEASSPRMAHYAYGPLESDQERAYVSVYFDGSGKGLAWRDQFNLWIENMIHPEGRDPYRFAVEHDRVVGGMQDHVVSLTGPMHRFHDEPEDKTAAPETICRVAGVAVEAPGGTVFFRLSGPEYTARIMTEAYMNMIYRLKKTTP